MRRRAFLGTAAVALAAPAAAFGTRTPRGEVGILQDALELELLAVYVYDAGIRSGLLDEALLAKVTQLRDHEQEHAGAIGSSLEALGGARPVAPATPEQADALLERLGTAGRLTAVATRDDFFALAEEVELRQVAAYGAAVGDLEDVRLIQTAASILAAQGAHLVVIRGLLGRQPVPTALETGRG